MINKNYHKFQSFAYEADFSVIMTRIPYSVHGICADSLNVDLSSYRLADPAYYNQSKIKINGIDALLRIEAFDKIVNGPIVCIENVTLRDMKFGWTSTSTINQNQSRFISNHITDNPFCCCMSVSNLDNRLKLFWQTEEVAPINFASIEFDQCNEFFEKTYSRDI